MQGNLVEPFLHLAHVNVARGENVVLHDINLSVNAGEHIAILGPNGCGKSTLIKTITCECYPVVHPEMKVRIFGRELVGSYGVEEAAGCGFGRVAGEADAED
ncbi:ATP-binding cassette domain-containing protein [Tunturiibacter empetritectus]|uniref:ATP-binding cassette domain-containing protein n=1 Tax=Tunturiibacter empetritectus TaxID=3069691 RepID=UPI003D9ACE08